VVFPRLGLAIHHVLLSVSRAIATGAMKSCQRRARPEPGRCGRRPWSGGGLTGLPLARHERTKTFAPPCCPSCRRYLERARHIASDAASSASASFGLSPRIWSITA
jgi:hypothetical protein